MKANALTALLFLTTLVSCEASTQRPAMHMVLESDSLKRETGTDSVVAKHIVADTVKLQTDTAVKSVTKQKPIKTADTGSKADKHTTEVKKYDNRSAEVVKQLEGGVYRVKYRGHVYDYIVVDLDKSNVRLCWKNSKGQKYNNIQSVLNDTAVVTKGAVQMVANAGMYTHESDPQGLYIEDGKKHKNLDTLKPNNGDNFHLKPNGVFYLDSAGGHIDTTEFYARHIKHEVKYATQSGPMLVINGAIHPAFKEGSENLNIRNGVGIADSNHIVFAISEGPTNFYDFAALFKYYLECRNALYLDGAISKTYIPGLRETDTGGNFGPLVVVTKRKSKQ